MSAAAMPLGLPASSTAALPQRPMRRASDFAAASGLSPVTVLGPALVEAVLQLVRGELQARMTPAATAQRSPWMSPPAASHATRVPVKTIRSWVQDGRIRKRLKNRSPDPKQPKYLVNIDDVIAAAEAWTAPEAAPARVNDVKEQARQLLAARATKGR